MVTFETGLLGTFRVPAARQQRSICRRFLTKLSEKYGRRLNALPGGAMLPDGSIDWNKLNFELAFTEDRKIISITHGRTQDMIDVSTLGLTKDYTMKAPWHDWSCALVSQAGAASKMTKLFGKGQGPNKQENPMKEIVSAAVLEEVMADVAAENNLASAKETCKASTEVATVLAEQKTADKRKRMEALREKAAVAVAKKMAKKIIQL